jgi:plasmid stability protein
MEPFRSHSVPVDLSIKRVPDAVAERLRERARQNHRSLQGELLAILEEAAGAARALTVDEIVAFTRRGGIRTRPTSAAIVREDRDRRRR